MRQLSRNNKYKLTNSIRSGRKIIAQYFNDDPSEAVKLECKMPYVLKFSSLL